MVGPSICRTQARGSEANNTVLRIMVVLMSELVDVEIRRFETREQERQGQVVESEFERSARRPRGNMIANPWSSLGDAFFLGPDAQPAQDPSSMTALHRPGATKRMQIRDWGV